MLDYFIKWYYGYLFVRIKGNSPERFINLCRSRDVLIWNIKKCDGGYEFLIPVEHFKELRYIAKKTKTRPYIRRRKGFPFYIKKIWKRKGLCVGVTAFFFLLYFLSTFIWDIQFSGQYTYTSETLMKFLQEIDVYAGMQKKNLDCPAIETAIREKYTDIGWVSAERKGTKLFIRIKETKMPTLYEERKTPVHLKASCDGVITSIVTRKGTPKVKKGDRVKKGDILISGVVEVVGDNQLLVNKEAVAADGDVMIETTIPYKNQFPRKHVKKIYTGKEQAEYRITFHKNQIILVNPFNFLKKIQKYDIVAEKKQIYLNHSLTFPIELEKITKREYKNGIAIYTDRGAKKLAKKQFSYFIEKLMEKGVLIKENNVKIVVDKTNCTSNGNLKIEKKADSFCTVKEDEWRFMLPDEHSGDNN